MERGERKGTLETRALRDPRAYPGYKDLREYRCVCECECVCVCGCVCVCVCVCVCEYNILTHPLPPPLREYQETWEVKDREGLRVWRVDRDSRETWGRPDHLGETPVAPLLRRSEGRGRWRWCLAPPDPRDQW